MVFGTKNGHLFEQEKQDAKKFKNVQKHDRSKNPKRFQLLQEYERLESLECICCWGETVCSVLNGNLLFILELGLTKLFFRF